MATAQEILQKIKENKRKENEKLFTMDKTSSGRNNSTIYSSATDGRVHRLSTVNYTYQQEYTLYLNLVVYYILNQSIIPPLHPYQKMLKKIVPRVYDILYGNGTYYCMLSLNKQLLNTVVTISKDINELNKVTCTLLASVPKDIVNDINDVLQDRRFL